MKRLYRMILALLVLSITLTGCYEEKAKIVDDFWFGDSNRYNGWALAMDGNFAAIGNPQGYNVYDMATGSVYIAERINGDWQASPQKLAPTDLQHNDFFGASVGMDSSRLIVGASHRQKAFVYARVGFAWYREDSFSGSDVRTNDNFGYSVDISGDWAIVGAPTNDDEGIDAGAVYLFQRSGGSWVQRDKMVASDGMRGDQYGWSVAIDGNYAIVGSPFDNNIRGADAGSIYILRRNGSTWVQEAKNTGSLSNSGDYLGWSVAISGNYYLAGAYGNDNANGSNAGAAFFYVRSGNSINEVMKIIADDGAKGDRFGFSVALTDYFATIGAPYDDNSSGVNAGASYVYYRPGGDELNFVEKLYASDGEANDYFGWGSAMSGDYAVFSALYDDNAVGRDAGAAYVFEQEK